jgi:hypothetical protein
MNQMHAIITPANATYANPVTIVSHRFPRRGKGATTDPVNGSFSRLNRVARRSLIGIHHRHQVMEQYGRTNDVCGMK